MTLLEDHPTPNSTQELAAFDAIQRRLGPLFARVFPDPLAHRTVVVVPSLSLDTRVLEKIEGVQHYEERLLFMLMLLRLPRTRVILLTSLPIGPSIIDYYLHLLPGIPSHHARRRLKLFPCFDASLEPLTKKVLDRPRLLERVRNAIDDLESAHMTCFNATELERTLAVRLGIPLYACDPAHCHSGSKSGSRLAFKEAGIDLPPGFEGLRDENDIVAALTELKREDPGLRRAVVKLEHGASGEGNAIFRYDGAPGGPGLAEWVGRELPARLAYESADEHWDHFRAKYREMGGIVEAFVEGSGKQSPSVQCRIDPMGNTEIVSTHDQILGGPSGQVFLGSTFPAHDDYRMEVQAAGQRVANVLTKRGALGRFGIDFVSVPTGDGAWKHYAIEINLRKGGTTHTFMMLQFLTDGTYSVRDGIFRTPSGGVRCYYATDNLAHEAYRGLLPEDLIDIVVNHGLHFHSTTQKGVMFHLIGALSQYGKMGLVCVAENQAEARDLYRQTVAVLDQETGVSS